MQSHAMRAWEAESDFRAAIESDPEIRAVMSLEQIAEAFSLERQLRETDRIADASRTMLDIAQENDAIAREFNSTVQNLVASGKEFESEVARFRLTVK